MDFILASRSPRRRSLLEQIGISPIVAPADIDETPLPGEASAPYVERLAIEKAATYSGSDALVVGADTIVSVDGDLLGKPVNDSETRAQLRRLSGRDHSVLTGVAVMLGNHTVSRVESTTVNFAPLTEADIAWYVASGEPSDKAGSYAIQGAGGLFVTRIHGSFDNVVGLPRNLLASLVAELGHSLLSFMNADQAAK